MRLIEKCQCGASLEVSWDITPRYPNEDESPQAQEAIRVFHDLHSCCRVFGPAKTGEVDRTPMLSPGEKYLESVGAKPKP